MKRIKYGLLCEDSSHKIFIEGFINNYNYSAEYRNEFVFSDDFFCRFLCRNSKDVLKRYVEAGIVGSMNYELDLLLIGIDYDDRDRKSFDYEIERLYNQIHKKIRIISVIFFPVQAIEHWLMYIKYHYDNPKSTKNVSFENISRKNAKMKIYAKVKTIKNDREKIVTDIVGKIDLKWLISRSDSFKRFNGDFINFIQNFNK